MNPSADRNTSCAPMRSGQPASPAGAGAVPGYHAPASIPGNTNASRLKAMRMRKSLRAQQRHRILRLQVTFQRGAEPGDRHREQNAAAAVPAKRNHALIPFSI